MPRWFFVVLTLFGLAGVASYAATAPDPLGLLWDKASGGGVWTVVAVFVVLAAILGYWPRRADGTLRLPGK